MSFSAGFSGHTEAQSEFEDVVSDLKEVARKHQDRLSNAYLSGTDNDGNTRSIDFLSVLRNEESDSTVDAPSQAFNDEEPQTGQNDQSEEDTN